MANKRTGRDKSRAPRRGRARRAPEPEERTRDAERSRERLLAAALEEFAAKGFAGARVSEIAARAGLNKQLIGYYFGGKQGLYSAVQGLWEEQEETFAHPELPLDELMVAYLHASLADPRMSRLLLWEGLAEATGAGDRPPSAPAGSEDLSDLRRRQVQGELASDLDPGLFQLAFMGAVLAPTAMPQIVRRITGLDPASREFERRYSEQLRRIIRRLAAQTHDRQAPE